VPELREQHGVQLTASPAETFATALKMMDAHASTFEHRADFPRRKDCEGYRWLLQCGEDVLEHIRDRCLVTTDMLEARVLAEAALEILKQEEYVLESSIPDAWNGQHEKVVAYTLGLIKGYLG
jgi:hypothetical protein